MLAVADSAGMSACEVRGLPIPAAHPVPAVAVFAEIRDFTTKNTENTANTEVHGARKRHCRFCRDPQFAQMAVAVFAAIRIVALADEIVQVREAGMGMAARDSVARGGWNGHGQVRSRTDMSYG